MQRRTAIAAAAAFVLAAAVVAASGRPAALAGGARPSRADAYLGAAEAGVAQARAHWWDARLGWYRDRLDPSWSPAMPLARLWSAYPLFESLDAIAIASPTPAHVAAVRTFAARAERYWNPAVGGYAYYPGTDARVDTYFDDNGWWAIAFLDAYRATHDRRYLADAARAFDFVVGPGRAGAGGGTWWDTAHRHTTSEPLAAAAYVGVGLYDATHEARYLREARSLVAWAGAHAWNAQRQLYGRSATDGTVMDYVQGMMIGADLELCRLPGGGADCRAAERLAATSATAFALDWQPAGDAIYLRFLLDLYRSDHDRRWRDLVVRAVERAQARSRGADGLYVRDWTGHGGGTGPLVDHAATVSVLAWLAAADSGNAVAGR